LDAIDTELFERVSDAHDPAGRVLQLLAIIGDTTPEVKALGIGNELRCFALHMARMDPGVDFVCAVTRCSDFRGEESQIQSYVDDHVSGKVVDSTIGFHTGYGAKVVKIVPGYRPEDVDNKGIGVLIKYDIKEWKAKDQAAAKRESRTRVRQEGAVAGKGGEQAVDDMRLGLEIVGGIMDDIGYPVKEEDLTRGFFGYGMDSLDLVRIRNKIGAVLGVELSTTLLLDFPNVAELADFLDQERGLGKYQGAAAERTVWEKLEESEIGYILDKLNKFYSLPQYQTKINDTEEKAGGVNGRYLSLIQSFRSEVEGSVFVANDVISEPKAELIEQAREELQSWITKNGKDHPKIRLKYTNMMKLLKIPLSN